MIATIEFWVTILCIGVAIVSAGLGVASVSSWVVGFSLNRILKRLFGWLR